MFLQELQRKTQRVDRTFRAGKQDGENLIHRLARPLFHSVLRQTVEDRTCRVDLAVARKRQPGHVVHPVQVALHSISLQHPDGVGKLQRGVPGWQVVEQRGARNAERQRKQLTVDGEGLPGEAGAPPLQRLLHAGGDDGQRGAHGSLMEQRLQLGAAGAPLVSPVGEDAVANEPCQAVGDAAFDDELFAVV